MKEYDKAVDYCLKAKELDPKWAKSYYILGAVYKNTTKYDLAVKNL